MNELQQENFQLFCHIINICDEEHIPYILLGGTLLGAVRDNGFIPWDDDMDIGFTRKNYDKFLTVALKRFKATNYEVHLDNTDMIPYGLSRIVNKKVKINMASHSSNHLFIDIIPLDKLPKYNKWAYTKFHIVNGAINNRCSIVNHNSRIKKVAAIIIKTISRPLSIQFLKKLRRKLMTKYEDSNTTKYYNLVSPYPFGKEYFTEEELSNFEDCMFENINVKIPKGSINFLERLYGNWKVEPSKSEKRVHLTML